MELFGENCAVSLSVELPRALAAEVEEVQRRDPEMLRRILMYGMTRRAIYESLATATAESLRETTTKPWRPLRRRVRGGLFS